MSLMSKGNPLHTIQCTKITFRMTNVYIQSLRSKGCCEMITKTVSSLEFLHRVSEGVVSIVDFQNMGSTSMTLDFLHFCFNEGRMNLSTISLNMSDVFDEREQDEMQSNRTLKMLYPEARYDLNEMLLGRGKSSNCQKFFNQFKSVSVNYTNQNPMYIIAMNMEELLKVKFPYARYNYSSNIQYQECVALETEILPQIEGYIVEFRCVEEILMNLTTWDIQESLVLSKKLSSYYDEIINIGLIYHKYQKKLNESCNWIKPVLSHQNVLLDEDTVTEEELDFFRNEIDTTSVKIKSAYTTLYHYYVEVIHPDIQILQGYLLGNVTKVELSEKLRSLWETRDDLNQLNEDLR